MNLFLLNRLNDSYKVDNFDALSRLIRSESGKVYYLEISKRYKDNYRDPTITNHYNKIIKPYWITSFAQLLKKRNEIISICEDNNARAYIFLNAREKAEMDSYAKTLEGNLRYNRYVQAYRQSLDRPDRAFVLIDVDSVRKDIHKHVLYVIQNEHFTILHKYISPSGGLHVIVKERAALNIDWQRFGYGKGLYAIVNSEIDASAILYANLTTDFNYDIYSNRRKSLAGIEGEPERVFIPKENGGVSPKKTVSKVNWKGKR